MSEMKVQIPDGWRWVEVGEERGGKEWRYVTVGKWQSIAGIYACCDVENTYITPIAPAQPETLDVPIYHRNATVVFDDPNSKETYPVYQIYAAPCLVGPEWAFAGFVWRGLDCENPTQEYYMVRDDHVDYAVAVRFRRVSK